MHADMATEGVRHMLGTCFHKKKAVKLTSAYPETHSINSAYIQILQIINSCSKLFYIQQQQKALTYLPFFFTMKLYNRKKKIKKILGCVKTKAVCYITLQKVLARAAVLRDKQCFSWWKQYLWAGVCAIFHIRKYCWGCTLCLEMVFVFCFTCDKPDWLVISPVHGKFN